MAEPLLRVENLRTYFRIPNGTARAVDGVDFSVDEGETLAIVGESGCGKSMTGLSLLQLVPEPAGYVEDGRVLFNGKDLLDYTWEEMRRIRGREIAMIFQEPMTSLNPTFTIGAQLVEAIRLHNNTGAKAARERAEESLRLVDLSDPAQAMRQYPHELSGGMRQRVMIAMALVNRPKLLIADEPTTALDVTVQAQILKLIRDIQLETRMAVLLITHDLGIVSEVSDNVAVMYAGQIVESGPTRTIFGETRHPYTRGLLASRPSRSHRGKDLATLDGRVPEANDWPPACRFEPRCPYRWKRCACVEPRVIDASVACSRSNDNEGTTVRCNLYDTEVEDRPDITTLTPGEVSQ
ncbi:MAG: ABC transporter ATP-binding protein [Armatimonadetes bacterium]|nr:ABC transporter ATP-binding protein [Armatimonadota bacterium]